MSEKGLAMNPKLSSNWWVTTANRSLINQCILDFDGLRSWTTVLRVWYPRHLRTGVGCLFQGKVKTDKPPRSRLKLYTETQLHSHTDTQATQLHSYTRYSDTQAPQAIHDSASEGRVTTLQEAVMKALSLGIDKKCMWNFARALKGFQKATGAAPELGSALSLWWATAKLPKTEVFEEYLWDLARCFKVAKVPLGASALEIAENSLEPLPPSSTPSQRLERLKALCSALQDHAGSQSFFLSLRDAARITATKTPYMAQNMIAFLIHQGCLKCVKLGGPSTQRASEYTYRAVPSTPVKY